jgi:hypothetical protein
MEAEIMGEGPQTPPQSQAEVDTRDRQAAMIELLERLLEEYWGRRYRDQQPNFLPGEIPSTLPVEVPIPGGSRVVGSASLTDVTNIIYECRLNQHEVARFYVENLVPQGWIRLEMPGPFGGGGFIHSERASARVVQFCLGERGLSLSVRSLITPGRATSVHVILNTNLEQSPCSPRQRRHYEMMRHEMPVQQLLPELKPPAGSMQMGGGSSGGSGNMSTDVRLETELDVSAILTHYDDQLEKAGWVRVSGGQSAPIGWSAWDFIYESEKWHGFFTAIGYPWSQGEYKLQIYVEVEGYGRRGGILFPHF